MVKQKTQLEEYKYALLVVLGTLFCVLLLSYFVATPMWKNMTKTNADLKHEKETLASLETKLENLKGLESKEKELKEQNAKVLAALPEDKDISRLFVQFESIATQSGLTVKSVSENNTTNTASASTTKQTSTNAAIVPVHYQISASGTSYDSIKTALSNFEKALRLVSVTTVDVTTSAENQTISFSVTTYKRGAK